MAVRVEIYERQIVAHFSPGGVVYRNGSKLGARASTLAKSFVGVRTGYLKSTITHGIQPRGLHTLVRLNAAAKYAPFVEHGTDSPITAGGKYMPLPAFRQYPAIRVQQVSGQRAQRYLQRGMNRALNSLGYGDIPGEF